MFEQLLWLRTVKKHKTCDLTRCYWNPTEKILFIGFEGIKFKSKRFVKNVPLSLLPEGWRVIIRNVWDDKCAYDYATGEEIDWESKEWDKLEGFIFSKLEWCLSHKEDLMKTYGEAIKRLFKKGYLEVEPNYLEWVNYLEGKKK